MPNSFGQLTNLEKLLATNCGLTGDIPNCIWQLSSLKELWLNNNNFTGIISEEIGKLYNIENLSITFTNLGGSIPRNIGNLTKLKTLFLNNNKLIGDIPESIGNLVQAESIFLNNNAITGALPETLGNLRNLTTLWLNNNQINGNIPKSIGNLTNLEWCELGNNNLEGEIPEEFIQLVKLEVLSLNYNRLTSLPYKLYKSPLWKKWNDDNRILAQQNGYTITVNDSYVSSDFSKDGETTVLQSHSKGNGIKLVLMGDMFVDTDMKTGGLYESAMKECMEAYFSIEPFKSLRDYFDVICIKAVSKHDWPSGETAFETKNNQSGWGLPGYHENTERCIEYAQKALKLTDLDDAQIVTLLNGVSAGHCGWSFNQTSVTSFVCLGYNDGKSLEEFAEILHHEIGHGFGLFEDEYIMVDGATVPATEIEMDKEYYKKYGYHSNIDYTSNPGTIKWAHFINDTRYADEEIGIYEGAYYQYGVYRATEYSIMRESHSGFAVVGQFNAPMREAIYKRAMKLAYGNQWTYNYEDFVQFDTQGHRDYVIEKNNSQTHAVKSLTNSKRKSTRPIIYQYP